MTRASYYHQSAAHFVSEGVPVQIAEAGVEFVPHGSQRIVIAIAELET